MAWRSNDILTCERDAQSQGFEEHSGRKRGSKVIQSRIGTENPGFVTIEGCDTWFPFQSLHPCRIQRADIQRLVSPHKSPHKDVYDIWPRETYLCLSEAEGKTAAYEVYIGLTWCANQSVAGDLTWGGCREEEFYEDQ